MGKGEMYAGNQNYTNSGKPCVDWKQTECEFIGLKHNCYTSKLVLQVLNPIAFHV